MRSALLVRALAVTWLVTAVWDFLCATALAVYAYGSTLPRLWQGVASTVLGPRAGDMGTLGVVAGLGLHLSVAFTWSAIFVLACVALPRLRRLIERPAGAAAAAVMYGPVIWLAMSLAVIPLATGRPPSISIRWWVQLFAHIPFVTVPLVFTARSQLGLPTRRIQATASPEASYS